MIPQQTFFFYGSLRGVREGILGEGSLNVQSTVNRKGTIVWARTHISVCLHAVCQKPHWVELFDTCLPGSKGVNIKELLRRRFCAQKISINAASTTAATEPATGPAILLADFEREMAVVWMGL
jgi:hypothetical protein